MHGTFAVNGEGIPLGVPRIELDCPEGGSDRRKPPEERKSARWLRGWRDGSALAALVPGVRVVSVMDREGDLAALFAERQARGGAELLVRAKHDRVLPDGERLFDAMRAAPAGELHEVRVERASARRSARGRKAFGGREARRAEVELRWRDVTIPIPRDERRRSGTAPVRLAAVHVRETRPPADGEALEWLLLTTLPVTGPEEAREVVGLYRLRWRIEDWHRILKTGCEVERLAHGTAARLKVAIATDAVIAWRLATLTLMGRDTPELPARTMFDEVELVMLLDYARAHGFAVPGSGGGAEPPEPAAVSLGEAVRLVARVGGYLDRGHDAPPGHQVVWEGYVRMVAGAKALERVARLGTASAFDRYRERLSGPTR